MLLSEVTSAEDGSKPGGLEEIDARGQVVDRGSRIAGAVNRTGYGEVDLV